MTNPYFPLLIMFAASLVLALGGIGASAILGPTRKSRLKGENFESGIDPSGQHIEEGRFPVRYYLVAMTFIIFDIEVVFMYPWAVSFDMIGAFGLFAMLTFIALITVPYIYEWRRGGLDY